METGPSRLRHSQPGKVLMFLRKQIDMRVVGCGLTQFATRWSSNKDSKIGTVGHLRGLVSEILEHETAARRLMELPEEAALPQQVSRDLCLVAAPAEDSCAKISSRRPMIAKASISLVFSFMSGVKPALQCSPSASHCDDTPTPLLRWSGWDLPDTVVARPPAGMLLWAWDADPEFDEAAGEKWLALLPKKWNKQQIYSWRYDPREFAPAATPERDPRRRNARAMDTD